MPIAGVAAIVAASFSAASASTTVSLLSSQKQSMAGSVSSSLSPILLPPAKPRLPPESTRVMPSPGCETAAARLSGPSRRNATGLGCAGLEKRAITGEAGSAASSPRAQASIWSNDPSAEALSTTTIRTGTLLRNSDSSASTVSRQRFQLTSTTPTGAGAPISTTRSLPQRRRGQRRSCLSWAFRRKCASPMMRDSPGLGNLNALHDRVQPQAHKFSPKLLAPCIRPRYSPPPCAVPR